MITSRYSKPQLVFNLFILFTMLLLHANGQSWSSSSSQPKVYKGNLSAVVRVEYGAVMFSGKVKGYFEQIGDHLWREINGDDLKIWRELVRRNSSILLVDTAGDKQMELNLGQMQVNKANNGTSILHGIKNVKEGTFTDLSAQYIKPKKVINTYTPATTSQVNQPVASGNSATNAVNNEPEWVNPPVYHAILIAENNYKDSHFNSLPGTVSDMRKMYNLLTNWYNFDPANTDTLVSASRENILSVLNARAKAMTENDNLFIFYAGHGMVRSLNDGTGKEEGFLIPADAEKDDEITFINSDDIMRIINRGSKAKHILFVADACFAGTLFRDLPSDVPASVREAYKDKSRRLLSSGNRQAVSDQSDFVEYFRLALQENRAKFISTEQLVDGFKDQYIQKTKLKLQYYPIQGVGDMGGHFVFMRKP